MQSLQELLQHDALTEAEVVAGHQGLDRTVSWVHTASVPDAHNWVNGGELLLTTAINIPQEESAQRDYLRLLNEKGVAGVVLTIGRYIDTIPEHLRVVADECALPLLEIPYEARFVDIARKINEQIATQNLQMLENALHIHQTLTQLISAGGGIPQLAERLADLVGHSISIETERFEAIATRNISAVDEARRYTQIHGHTDPRLVTALESGGFLPRIRESLRPVYLKPMPEVGLEMERILAPIVVHGEIYGYMWIIADDQPLTQIDMMAIESGSTTAAVIMLYQESLQSAEASVRGGVLSQLVRGEGRWESELVDQSLQLDIDLREPYTLFLIKPEDSTPKALRYIFRNVNRLVTHHQVHATAGQFSGQVLVIAATEDPENFAQQILQRVHNGDKTSVQIAISSSLQGIEQVPLAYQQCIDTLTITRKLRDTAPIVHFNALGYIYPLYKAGSTSLDGNPTLAKLQPIFNQKSNEYIETLEAYLQTGGNGVQTAENLHIHRSTLNYRLARIQELCGLDLSQPQTRLDVQIVLTLIRLFA